MYIESVTKNHDQDFRSRFVSLSSFDCLKSWGS